ncbi:hypothetical protein N9C33_04615 [Crocinitomicaceae bacterium]|nr:hypothetical protein [Crocinitomicaceae bacterium]
MELLLVRADQGLMFVSVNNAMSIMDPSSYDADLQKECEEYANGLNDEDKAERALNALKCMTN